MRDPTQFRIGFALVCLALIVYLFLTVFDGKTITLRFHDFLATDSGSNHTNHSIKCLDRNSTLTPESSTNENEQSVLDETTQTVLNRTFFQYLINHLRDTPYPGVDNYIQYTIAHSRRKSIPNVQPLRADFGQVVNDVCSFKYPIHFQCSENKTSSKPSIFIAIISAPSYFEKRNMIRQTWINSIKEEKYLNSLNLVGYKFILGLPQHDEEQVKIKAESEIHGDILQIDMIDDYYNLTLKVVGLLNWLNTYCAQVDFVLKADDDVFVNVHNLIAVTKALNSTPPIIYGQLSDSLPHREGTWKISHEDWPWSSYPTYFRGASVLLPGNTIGLLLAAAQATPYLPFDDTYLTGLCAEKGGITVRHADKFFIGGASDFPEPCHVYKSVTWLTSSSDHLNSSHIATERFYNSLTPCFEVDKNGRNRSRSSNDTFRFPFL